VHPSALRDRAAERTDYSRDVAATALAHAIGDEVEAPRLQEKFANEEFAVVACQKIVMSLGS
jgi:hypothetical protein